MRLANQILTLKPEGAYGVLTKSTEMERQGKNIVHLEIGQPDFPTPKNIVDAAIRALNEGQTKYTSPLGILSLRKAIAEMVSKTRGIDVSPARVAVTPSGKTAIYTAMALVIEPGSEVIVPNPSFPVYQVITDYLGAVQKPIPLLEKNGFSFDMKKFRKTFSRKTRLIILNSPSNPTGGVMPMKDLLEIAEMVRGTDCWIMTDEIYARLLYDLDSYPSFYSIKGIQDRTILVDGLSKTYSMTGWRIGYLVAPEKFMKYVDYFLTHTIACTASFTQLAALEAFTGPQESIGFMVTEFKKRRDFIYKRLNKIPGISCLKPAGAFYAFPNITSFKKTSAWLADYLLENAGVALLDGTAFGEYGEGYLRISYSNSLENLNEGLNRIENALARL